MGGVWVVEAINVDSRYREYDDYSFSLYDIIAGIKRFHNVIAKVAARITFTHSFVHLYYSCAKLRIYTQTNNIIFIYRELWLRVLLFEKEESTARRRKVVVTNLIPEFSFYS